jgi:hypothetical protein
VLAQLAEKLSGEAAFHAHRLLDGAGIDCDR